MPKASIPSRCPESKKIASFELAAPDLGLRQLSPQGNEAAPLRRAEGRKEGLRPAWLAPCEARVLDRLASANVVNKTGPQEDRAEQTQRGFWIHTDSIPYSELPDQISLKMCDDFNLHRSPSGQGGDLHGGARGKVGGEVLGVNVVHGAKIREVRQKDGRLNNV